VGLKFPSRPATGMRMIDNACYTCRDILTIMYSNYCTVLKMSGTVLDYRNASDDLYVLEYGGLQTLSITDIRIITTYNIRHYSYTLSVHRSITSTPKYMEGYIHKR